MGHAVLQPLRVGLSRVPHIWIRVFLRDQPYGVVIEPLIRDSVDALRQHCPTKRLTPMGLLAGESARRLCCFRWEVSTFIGVDGCEGLFTGAIVRRFCGFIR